MFYAKFRSNYQLSVRISGFHLRFSSHVKILNSKQATVNTNPWVGFMVYAEISMDYSHLRGPLSRHYHCCWTLSWRWFLIHRHRLRWSIWISQFHWKTTVGGVSMENVICVKLINGLRQNIIHNLEEKLRRVWQNQDKTVDFWMRQHP